MSEAGQNQPRGREETTERLRGRQAMLPGDPSDAGKREPRTPRSDQETTEGFFSPAERRPAEPQSH